MIVPDYWAEARRQHKSAGKQVTVLRYGWSVATQADAQLMAEQRADEALQAILAGESLDRRERKVAYNGADGMPIREEVLARHGEEVITRNAYGAHCLNSPSALFADIDFNPERGLKPILFAFAVLALASVATGGILRNAGILVGLLIASLVAAAPLASVYARIVLAAGGGAEHVVRTRIADFIADNPSWNLRLYRTPAGYRVLATHRPFEARTDEVQRFFASVSADPVYVRMCTNQNCFRARLTAKPWRIAVSTHMRPRPWVWPVRPEASAVRKQWIADYETKAAAFAACRYTESMGSGVIHEAIKAVIALHDSESRALLSGAEIA